MGTVFTFTTNAITFAHVSIPREYFLMRVIKIICVHSPTYFKILENQVKLDVHVLCVFHFCQVYVMYACYDAFSNPLPHNHAYNLSNLQLHDFMDKGIKHENRLYFRLHRDAYSLVNYLYPISFES